MRTATGIARIAVALGLATAVLAGGGAHAGPSAREYAVTLAPVSAIAGTSAVYRLTLANAAASTHALGSANVAVPPGFQVTSVGAPTVSGGTRWSVSLVADVLELRALTQGDAIAPGETVAADVTVATACTAATSTWATQAKQSNGFNGPPGNDFAPAAPDPTLTVTGGGPVAVSFGTQPSTTRAGSAIAPAVTVSAVDACGRPAAGEVSVALGANPSGGTLAGTRTRPLSGGTATFGDLSVDRSGLAYTLVATVGGVSAPSAPFDVVDELCTPPASTCTASDRGRSTTVTTDGPPAGGTMAFLFETRSSLTCGSRTIGVRGALAIIDPVGYTEPIAASARWSKAVAPGTGVANFRFCWSKDGLAWSTVEPCTRAGTLPSGVGLCELKRNRNGVGELVIEFLLDPVDPWAGMGD